MSEPSLKRAETCLSGGCGEKINAGDPLPPEKIPAGTPDDENSKAAANVSPLLSWSAAGTEPEADNFRNLSLTPAGLKITFNEYQVGPGCLGIFEITIPFEDLRSVLRRDWQFN